MKWFFDLGKPNKLHASFTLLVALAATIGIFAIVQLGQLESAIAELQTRRMPSIGALLGMKSDLTRFRMEEQQHLLAVRDGEAEKYRKLMDVTMSDFRDKLERYAKLATEPEEKRIYLEVAQLWERYMQEHAKTLALAEQSRDDDARLFAEDESRRLYSNLSDRFDRLTELNVRQAIKSGQEGEQIYSTSRVFIIGLTVGIGMFGLAAWIMRRQAKRAADLGDANRTLSEEIALRKESEEMLRRLSAHQENIREDERKRIADEIHDELGQNLMALRMDVSLMLANSPPDSMIYKQAEYALRTIDASINSVRGIIGNLRPAVLKLGLPAAIEWQLREFERINKIACKLLVNEAEFDTNLNDERMVAVFRILQESLANTARHAQATQVTVELRKHDNRISMTVKDNGVGFQLLDRRKTNTFGLLAIKERVQSLGGELFIDSSQGTLLSISLPINQSES